MYLKPFFLIAFTVLLASCSGTMRDRVVVSGIASEDFLKLRSGPGLGFNVVLGLPDGTVLNRRDCVTEVGQLWCQVTLADGRGVSGYVAADYLIDQ